MQVVDRDGFLKVRLSGASDGLTVGTTPITSGTEGRILFEGAGNVLQQSSSLFWDSTNNRLGIGTSSPLTTLYAVGNEYSFLSTSGSINFYHTPGVNSHFNFVNVRQNSDYIFKQNRGGVLNTTSLILKGLTGNLLIDTTTDAGFRLDVNGTARVVNGLTSTGTNYLGRNYLAANTSINSTGDPNIHKLNNDLIINAGASPQSIYMYANNLVALSINSSGNVGIGTTSPSTLLHIAGNITIGGASATTVSSTYNSTTRNQIRYTNGSSFEFHEGVNERARFAPSSGNLLINTTTDAGYRLDVNGTARVSGQTIIKGTTNNNTTNIFRVEQFNGNGRFLVNSAGQILIIGEGYTLDENFVSISRENFNPTSGSAAHNSLYIGTTINQTGSANGITRGLYINPTLTSAADFRAIETTSGNVLFGTGFFWDNTNNRLGINTSTPSSPGLGSNPSLINIFSASGNSGLTLTVGTNNWDLANVGGNGLWFLYNNSIKAIFFNNGNLAIGTTTDSGYKLDVNGTTRVQNNFTIGNNASGVRRDLNFNVSFPGTGTRGGVVWSSGASILNRRKYSGGNDNTISFLIANNSVELLTIQEHNGTINTYNIGINNSNPDASAKLDVVSTTQGFLPPRMTTTQKNAISSPAEGLQVYDTDLRRPCFYDGSTWKTL